MKLFEFDLSGFRRIRQSKVKFGDATFLIGENNVGKSSILKAIEIFLSGHEKLEEQDFFFDQENELFTDEVVMEAKFIDLPSNALGWRGFKGRVIKETIDNREVLSIVYRKTFKKGASKYERHMLAYPKNMKSQYDNAESLDDFIQKGIPKTEIEEVFGTDFDKDKKLTKKQRESLDLISELWEFDEGNKEWVSNPGGIDGNILKKLPKYLGIPAADKIEEIGSTSGTLQKTLKQLFDEVREKSENYKNAQTYLAKLAKELDPEDASQDFGKMMDEINDIVSDIFLDTKIHVEADLSDASTLKPSFKIEMSSNVRTTPDRQGLGSIRSAVFALLRYREKFLQQRNQDEFVQDLIIGFEEPELYLHPNAANLMRDKIYDLAVSTHTKLICTTHSPYMIDLSKRIDDENVLKQVLNLVKIEFDDDDISSTKSFAFNTTDAFKNLIDNDKDYVKFLLKIDDSISRVFFSKKTIIIEGDSEEIVFKETISRLPHNISIKVKSDYQIVKARGKAIIISLIKYLRLLGIEPFVIHDRDELEGATRFNEPILNALDGEENSRLMLENNLEDVLGYDAPNTEKPFNAFKFIKENWGEDWDGVEDGWKELVQKRIFNELFNN